MSPAQRSTLRSMYRYMIEIARHHYAGLKVLLNGQCLKHDPQSVYLRVTLDRTLSYRAHLSKTAVKLKIHNNLISKLIGSSWRQRQTLSGHQLWHFGTLLLNTATHVTIRNTGQCQQFLVQRIYKDCLMFAFVDCAFL